MGGGLFDIIAATAQTYRQNILFSIDNDNLIVTTSLVRIYLDVLPAYYRKSATLTPLPEHDGILEEEYKKLQRAWVLENLYKVEECYSKVLYNRKELFSVLQGAAIAYRQSILFNLNREKNPVTAKGLIKIMNMLLPESQRATFPELPESKGISSLSWKRDADMRKWILECLRLVEGHLANYVYRLAAQGQH